MNRHGLLLSGLAAFASAPASAQTGADESLAPYASTADTVTLADGRRIHFTCMGEGTPTVILTAGLGEWGITWNKVQPAIAGTTRACAWDRPGFGLSDSSPVTQTVGATTADLEEALAGAAFGGPYVIVGHSLGSYESLLFTDRHRGDVVGMVLVDPSIPDQWTRFARVAPAFDLSVLEQGGTAAMRKCAADLRSGAVAPGRPDPLGCLRPFPPAFPAALREALAPLRTPEKLETMASINSTLAASAALAVNPRRTYGDMPLIVLTATNMGPPPAGASAQFAAQMPRVAEEIDRGHDELAALSTRGVNARVPGATHAIQQVRPQVVIDAIEAVIAKARSAKR
jgi:pimeloyl-ACP methyl ester carboxylesterase